MTHAAAVKKAESLAYVSPFGLDQYVVTETRDDWDYVSEGSSHDYWRAIGELAEVRTEIVSELLGLDSLSWRIQGGGGRWRDQIRLAIRQAEAAAARRNA